MVFNEMLIFYSNKADSAEMHAQDFTVKVAELQRRLNM